MRQAPGRVEPPLQHGAVDHHGIGQLALFSPLALGPGVHQERAVAHPLAHLLRGQPDEMPTAAVNN